MQFIIAILDVGMKLNLAIVKFHIALMALTNFLFYTTYGLEAGRCHLKSYKMSTMVPINNII